MAVFGVGGVGGYTVEALARSGVGTLDLIDDDKVCLTNLNRQIIATHSTIDKYKVEVARERVLDINPKMNVHIYKTVYMPETADIFDFSQYDYGILKPLHSLCSYQKFCSGKLVHCVNTSFILPVRYPCKSKVI